MHVLTFLTRRIPGMSADEFRDHYETTHFELAICMPGLVSYRQTILCHGTGAWAAAADGFPDYDALSTYTFESAEAVKSAFASDAGIALDADTRTFMDWDSIVSIESELIAHGEA